MSNWSKGERLYNLLPAIYRIRDAERGEPLRALLSVMESELEAVEQDVAGLYENWFVETCSEWALPYLGDLLGVRLSHSVASSGVFSQRAFVANTLRYRRRKGTPAMLEDLARDVTGWTAHAVEFFELLGWTQHVNHTRYVTAANPAGRYPNAVDRVGTVNLRSRDVVDRLGGPFDVLSHTVDVRPMGQADGWPNIRKVGFFLWRLQHYPLDDVRAPRSGSHPDYGFHFSPLGNPAPLFTRPHEDDGGLVREVHAPGPIRPVAFYEDLARYAARYAALPPAQRPDSSDYYGPERSLYVLKDGVPVPPLKVMCKDLSAWARPPAGKVAVDVRLGRLTFPAGEEPARGVRVNHTYGFSADLGGGPYDRRDSLADPTDATLLVEVAKDGPVPTLQQALQQWADAGKPPCIIEIADSRVYGGSLDFDLPAGGWLAIQAADGVRPHVRPAGIARVTAPSGGATFLLNGLLVEGSFELNGALAFTMDHCTLVPGRWLNEEGAPTAPDRDSLRVVAASVDLKVTIRKSITGPLRLPEDAAQVVIEDSIVFATQVGGAARPALAADDAGASGPPATLERVTVWGPVTVRELTLASEVVFNAPVTAERRQKGCVRFSYVPPGSVTPARYRCQPDLALAERARALGLGSDADLPADERARVLARLRPEYTSERYGDPAFAQLSLACAEEVRTGAEDGAEMGAFEHLKQPQRTANLHARVEEYLPFGLEAGLVYVT